MRALLIEPHSPDTYPFIEGLHKATHCSVRHDQCLEDGLRTLEHNACDLVLVTPDALRLSPWQAVERVHSRANELLLKAPEVIVLFEKNPATAEMLKCRDADIMCIHREDSKTAYLGATLAFWRRATRKHQITLRITFQWGHHFIYFGNSDTHLDLGAQLTKHAVTLAVHGTCHVDFLADVLGVSKPTVKKYMDALRQILVVAQQKASILNPDRNVFWMKRGCGGTVCGVRAHWAWF